MKNLIKKQQERIEELEAASGQIDQAMAGAGTGYKEVPKHLKDVKANIEEQKKVCKEEKRLMEQAVAAQDEIDALDNAVTEAKFNEAKTRSDIQDLESVLARKYGTMPNGNLNMAKISSSDSARLISAYTGLANAKKSSADAQAAVDKKKGALEKKISVANRRRAILVKKTPELHKNKGVAEPCVSCILKKIQEQQPTKHWIKFSVKDEADAPKSDVSLKIILPDSNEYSGSPTNGILEVKNIEPGECEIAVDWSGLTIWDSLLIV